MPRSDFPVPQLSITDGQREAPDSTAPPPPCHPKWELRMRTPSTYPPSPPCCLGHGGLGPHWPSRMPRSTMTPNPAHSAPTTTRAPCVSQPRQKSMASHHGYVQVHYLATLSLCRAVLGDKMRVGNAEGGARYVPSREEVGRKPLARHQPRARTQRAQARQPALALLTLP